MLNALGDPTAAPTELSTDGNGATGEWTPDPSDVTRTAQGLQVARKLPDKTTIRYFGDYELQDVLGRGGMGVVYKALQVSLNRPVALKMIKAGVLADDAELKRFQNEAEAVALLDHAGVVPVYEVGEHEGQRYFSMKLVEGGNLAQQLASFTNNPRAAATLLSETAEAVHHAHMRGILHRDLKPANILIDAEGHPHVTDFGLARRVEGHIEMTQSGAVLGTPAYMSPEQASGKRASITTATDVYGLGAILYALLTGKAPFGGDSVIDTLDAVRNRQPEPPKKFNANVPRDLETICLKCLDKDPRKRYASAQELSNDLHNWLESRPITARRVGPAERAWLWCKRKPAVAGLAAAVLLAAVGGTTAVIAVQAKANKALQASNTLLKKQRVRAEANETQAIDAVKKFQDAVANEPTLKNSPALEDLRKRLLKEPIVFFRSLRDRLQADQDTRPESLRRLAQAGLDLGGLTNEIGDKQDALNECLASLAIWQRLAQENPADADLQNNLAVCLNNIGNLQNEAGRLAEALEAHEQTRMIWQSLASQHPTFTKFQNKLAGCYLNIGRLQSADGKHDLALASFEQARTIWERLIQEKPLEIGIQSDLAKCFNNIAQIQLSAGKPAEAMSSLEHFRDIQERLARDYPSVLEYQRHFALSQYNIAELMRTTGRIAEAVAMFQKTLEIREQLVQNNPSVTQFQDDLGMSYSRIGEIQRDSGQLDLALETLEKSLALYDRLVRANPTVSDFQKSLAISHRNLGLLQRKLGKLADAMASYEQARAIQDQLARQNPKSPELASELGGTLNNMAVLHLMQKQFEEALSRLTPAIEWQSKALAARPQNVVYRNFLANHLTNFIHASEGLGRTDEAEKARLELRELSRTDPRFAQLDARLDAVLKGDAPKTNAERLALAQRAYDKLLYSIAARLWSEAIESDPKLADDRQAGHRYNAACSAALAANGKATDNPKPDEAARVKLRAHALRFLRAEVTVWRQILAAGPPQARPVIVQTLNHWKEDADLAGVRDEQDLATLPESERKEWQALWSEVEALLKKAEAKSQ